MCGLIYILHKYFSEGHFQKVENKHCSHAYYNEQYSTMEEAERACAGDPKCQAVYDYECNGPTWDMKLSLCPADNTLRDSMAGSCVYEKVNSAPKPTPEPSKLDRTAK